MMKKKRTLLATLVLLSVMQGNVYAADLTTTAIRESGIYNGINLKIEGSSDLEGISFTAKNNDVNDNKIIVNLDGNETGKIAINGTRNVYGIWLSDTTGNAAKLEVNGNVLELNLTGCMNGAGNNVIGIWSETLYNPIPGAEDDKYAGGYIKLNNIRTDINIDTQRQAKGIVAGSDFGNNSEYKGHIELNGDVNITINNSAPVNVGANYEYRHIGIVACDGEADINKDVSIDITSHSGDGYFHEVAGLHTAYGGKIDSSNESDIFINIKGDNKVCGVVNSGLYDIIDIQNNVDNPSNINLNGNTYIKLDSADSIGVETWAKSTFNANNIYIDFSSQSNGVCTGIKALDDSSININNLYIGTGKGDFKNEGYLNKNDKVIAVTNSSSGFKGVSTNSTININCDNDFNTKHGTVMINGAVDANYKGTINLNLDNAESYLFGNVNTSISATTNILVTNSANWKNIGDSTLTHLQLSTKGLVDMTDKVYNDDFEKITIKTFDGSGGTIHMDIDASTNTDNSDRVYVDGTHSGTHYITLNNVGSNVDGAAGTVLVSVNDEQGEFKANDSEGTLYWNKYTLDRLDKTEGETVTDGYNTDWILAEVEQTDKPTTSVDTILGANALNYHTWLLESDKLMKRMGDLRHNGEDEQGAWFRVRGSKISRDDSAAFENKYTTYELGYDTLDKETENYKRYAGASISYSDGTSSYERGSGENSGKAISFYSTTMRNKGHYLDFVFKVVDMDNDFSVFDTNGNNISGAMDNQGISVNVEYGRKKDLGDKWYIEPQSQLTFGYLGGDNYKLNNGIAVDQGGISSLVGRIGFNIGRDIDEKTNLYLKANLLHEFLGDYSLDMTDTATGDVLRKDGSFGDTWGEIGIGAAIQTGKNNHIYFDVEKTFGGDFEKDWGWNAGMRWAF